MFELEENILNEPVTVDFVPISEVFDKKRKLVHRSEEELENKNEKGNSSDSIELKMRHRSDLHC